MGKIDLISRQAAIDALKNMYNAAEKWGKEASDDVIKARAESCMASLVEMKLRIEKLPSAQPEHGRWIKMSDADGIYYACSECGEELTRIEKFDSQFDLFPRLKSIDKTYFCPNCGARMGGENNEID